jgi:hypothetical protein
MLIEVTAVDTVKTLVELGKIVGVHSRKPTGSTIYLNCGKATAKLELQDTFDSVCRALDDADAIDACQEKANLNWLPIETAPGGEYFFATIAWGLPGQQCTGDAMRYKDKWIAAAVFYKGGPRDSRQFEYREVEVEPTHWSPAALPPHHRGKLPAMRAIPNWSCEQAEGKGTE